MQQAGIAILCLTIALFIGAVILFLWKHRPSEAKQKTPQKEDTDMTQNGYYDKEGYDPQGFDREGYDRDGLDREGYNREGYDSFGYARDGFNKDGFDRDGYDRTGFNKWGFDRDGFNREGLDRYGYNREGFDSEGYDYDGYDKDGFNREGYDRRGLAKDGRDIYGTTRTDAAKSEQIWLKLQQFMLQGFPDFRQAQQKRYRFERAESYGQCIYETIETLIAAQPDTSIRAKDAPLLYFYAECVLSLKAHLVPDALEELHNCLASTVIAFYSLIEEELPETKLSIYYRQFVNERMERLSKAIAASEDADAVLQKELQDILSTTALGITEPQAKAFYEYLCILPASEDIAE